MKDESEDRMLTMALSRKLGTVFEEAVKSYDLIEFADVYVHSDLCISYFKDLSIYSQSKKYVLELFHEELAEKGIKLVVEQTKYEMDVAYWMGYLLAEWHQCQEFEMSELTHAGLEWLYYGYDVFHTQDVKYVFELYKERKADLQGCSKADAFQ